MLYEVSFVALALLSAVLSFHRHQNEKHRSAKQSNTPPKERYSTRRFEIQMAVLWSGRSRYRNIVAQAEEIAHSGVREIVLTGVNIGDFGVRDGQRQDKFIDLLRALDRVRGIDRIRISSIEPNLLSNEIICMDSSSLT